MNTLINLLSPSAMHSLGWALLHFLWQGTGLAAIAAAAMALCRRPSARYAIGVGALVLMLLAPLVTFFAASQGHARAAGNAKLSPPAAASWPTVVGRAGPNGPAPTTATAA